MKNIKAALAAFVLFLITIIGIKVLVVGDMPGYNISYGTWIQESKFASNKGLKKLLEDKNSIPVFGSSELRHCQKTGFHADSIYKNTEIEPVFIGRGGYQSLNHAITLGSMGDTLKNRKVILSVSPQWFKNTGVKKDAFGASYSESNFIAFLQNKNISKSTKEYVIGRMKSLTDENPILWDRIQEDVKWYTGQKLNTWDSLRKDIHSYLTDEKSQMKLYFNAMRAGVLSDKNQKKENKEIKWNKFYKKAEKKGIKKTGRNKLGMLDKVYDTRYKKRVEENSFAEPSYYTPESIECEDLECFLDICKSENIEVLIIMCPFNGRWCDYLGLPENKRKGFYDKVKSIAREKGVQLADLSQYEYSDYIFEDDSHLALKGLVMFNEQIYNFYKQPAK
ncbi:MAG: D-alanyl-lipoteichoic acid biosynthesis protein DltD [Eubacterium sp.]